MAPKHYMYLIKDNCIEVLVQDLSSSIWGVTARYLLKGWSVYSYTENRIVPWRKWKLLDSHKSGYYDVEEEEIPKEILAYRLLAS